MYVMLDIKPCGHFMNQNGCDFPLSADLIKPFISTRIARRVNKLLSSLKKKVILMFISLQYPFLMADHLWFVFRCDHWCFYVGQRGASKVRIYILHRNMQTMN